MYVNYFFFFPRFSVIANSVSPISDLLKKKKKN